MINSIFSDKLALILDNAVRTFFDHPRATGRSFPGRHLSENTLTLKQQKHSAACMRINHAGEIAAQALYHGQATVSRSPQLRDQLHQAANEEGDHLVWCSQRLKELQSHKSWLTPIWYMGSFLIGSIAGLMGDRFSLGFVAETENQVMKHLEKHLAEISPADQRSLAILQQMHADETHHRDTALNEGAAHLPSAIKTLMQLTAAVMVHTAYWV